MYAGFQWDAKLVLCYIIFLRGQGACPLSRPYNE